MALKEKIQTDLIVAMKSKEEKKVSVLRLLKSAIMKFEVSGTEKREASDDEVMNIIGKEVKQRRDSIEAYEKGGRGDSAAAEKEELRMLQAYLPAPMSEDEVRKTIADAIKKTGAKNASDFGKVMGAVMPLLKGKADGQLVNKLVAEQLK